MKIIHQDGFSVEERVAYRAAIYQNLLESAQAIVFAMHKLSIHPTDPQNRVCHQFIPLHAPTDNSEHPGNCTTNRILRLGPLLR